MDKKVLIIEDDTFLQGLAATKLKKEGFIVLAAANSDQVSTILENDIPDIVLLDLVLPGTDGFGILKKIRENLKTKDTPVLIFSNLSDPKDMQKAKELGATDFMIKSDFTLDELTERVKKEIA